MSVCTEEDVAESIDSVQELAFEKYVLPEVDVLMRVARTLTRDISDTEDLVQDTLLRAYKGICGFDGRFPRAWLLTILRNTAVSRARRRRPEFLSDSAHGFESLAGAADPGDAPEGQIVDPTFDHALTIALDSLPPRFRQAVQLVDVEGFSYQEAAEALGVPIGTIMSRLHRARARLRNGLETTGLAPVGGVQ